MHLAPRTLRRAVTAVVAMTALPLLAPSAADAGELRFRDNRHDVMTVDLVDPDTVTTDPEIVNGDIRSAFIHYRKGHLVVRANFVELRRSRNTLIDYSGLLRTNRHREWLFDVITSPNRWAGHDTLFGGFDQKPCRIGHRLDYRKNFARVSIPLRCLGNPRWVQLQFGAATIHFDPKVLDSFDIGPGDLVANVDLAESETTDRTGWTPKVRRR